MEGFPYSAPVGVRYADVDAMNHVNNAAVVTYLEVARMALWRDRLGFSGSAREVPFILARVAVDYRAPIGLTDDVAIGVRVGDIGTSSFTLLYRVESAGRLAAEAETVQVWFDYRRGRPRPIPPAVRRGLAALRPAAAD